MTQASWPPAGQGWGAPMPPRRGGSVRTMVLTAALVVAGGVLALAAVAGEPSRRLLIQPELVVRRLEAFAR